MILKILRANALTVKNPYCRVYVEDELVGETPVRDDTTDPIFGGSSSSFKIEGLDATMVQVLIFDDPSERPTAKLVFKVLDVLFEQGNRNPNKWLDVTSLEDGSCAGRIQVCLLSSQIAPLQAQPSAKVLAPGPEIHTSLATSYAVRKMVMGSFAPVTLHVYDVSNDARVANINYYTKALGAGGIFHAAVEIYGREYSFGGSNRNISGIFKSPPKRCPLHHYRESIFLGDSNLSEGQVKAIIRDMTPMWMARSYNLFRKNCCFFSREFAIELGVGTIPSWVYQLATTAEPLEPYIIEYDNRRNGRADGQKMEVGEKPPENTEDRMVDHAMAARLQRTFRARTSVRESDSKK